MPKSPKSHYFVFLYKTQPFSLTDLSITYWIIAKKKKKNLLRWQQAMKSAKLAKVSTGTWRLKKWMFLSKTRDAAGEGNGTPLQYSRLENPMGGGAWWAAVHGVAKSQTRPTWLSLFTFTHWSRKWQPTPVFLPGESQGRGSLVGCHLWGRTESDTTEAT